MGVLCALCWPVEMVVGWRLACAAVFLPPVWAGSRRRLLDDPGLGTRWACWGCGFGPWIGRTMTSLSWWIMASRDAYLSQQGSWLPWKTFCPTVISSPSLDASVHLLHHDIIHVGSWDVGTSLGCEEGFSSLRPSAALVPILLCNLATSTYNSFRRHTNVGTLRWSHYSAPEGCPSNESHCWGQCPLLNFI